MCHSHCQTFSEISHRSCTLWHRHRGEKPPEKGDRHGNQWSHFPTYFWGFKVTLNTVTLNTVVQSCLTLWPHGPPCPSPAPGVFSNSCPLSRWCHLVISVGPFSRLQSFPASRSFPVSQFFTSGGQSIGVTASVSVLPMNIQDWFPLGWTCWISLLGTQESSPTPQFKSINSLVLSFLYSPTRTSIHDYWKNHNLD